MATLAVENVGKFAFFRDNEILIIDKITSNDTIKSTILKCPPVTSKSETTNGEKKCNKSESKQSHVLSADFSLCGSFLVVCDSNYRVILWKNEGNTWTIISTRHSARKCQKVIFSNLKFDIILADRGGDVFKFSTSELSKEGEFILGHICFITHLCISYDDKYLATCDRDGKIRISNYPNCYNIHSYCLGHSMFISSAFFLQSEQHMLISGAGDGTLRLWDFNCGIEKECENLCQNMTFVNDENKCDMFSSMENSMIAGLSKEVMQFSVQCLKMDPKNKLVAIVFHFLKGIALYKISDLKFQFKQLLNLSYRVKDVIFLANDNLLIISKDVPLTFCEFAIDPDTCFYKPCDETKISEVSEHAQKFYIGFDNTLNSADDEYMLFKKNYDNDDQEEHKSKKNKI